MPEVSGKVLAALSETLYLSTQDREIFWVSLEKSPLHRRCIRVSLLPKVAPGEKFFWRSPGMTFRGGSSIDFRTAKEWNPSVSGVRKSASPADLWDRFRRLVGMLDLLEVQEGVGRAISLAWILAGGGVPPAFPPTSGMGRVQEIALELAYSCLDQDFHSVTRIGKEMIGLGPGLTPSGDDFLGGLFFAARSLHRAFPKGLPWNENAVIAIMDWAKTRTHPISHTIFSDLALGHGPEPLHDLVGGLMEGKGSDLILKAALRLTAIGHSSGWDMVSGAVTGMMMAKKSVERESRNQKRSILSPHPFPPPRRGEGWEGVKSSFDLPNENSRYRR